MADAFSPSGQASLLVRRHHVRFLREAPVCTPLHMTAGLLDITDTGATFLQTLIHSRSGATAATFVTEVEHVAAREARPFPWPERARRAADRLRTEASADAGPRSIPAAAAPPGLEGLLPAGQGVVAHQDCDVFGRMRPELFIGRISDGLPHVLEPVREEAQRVLGPGGRVGGAALEYRLSYLEIPRAGDHLALRSGYLAVETKVLRLGHVLANPLTGKVWAWAEQVSVNFDLDARKAIPLPPEAVQRLRAALVRGCGETAHTFA
jgi:acyl-CoA thioester hydrolase